MKSATVTMVQSYTRGGGLQHYVRALDGERENVLSSLARWVFGNWRSGTRRITVRPDPKGRFLLVPRFPGSMFSDVFSADDPNADALAGVCRSGFEVHTGFKAEGRFSVRIRRVKR